jgi:hypothetical protein
MQTRATSTCFLLLLVLGHVWVMSGCGRDATGSADESPLHHHLVCVSPPDAQTESCGDAERLSLLNTWVKEAISLPNSTFSIWMVGSARNQYRHYFTACVPTQWPAPVSQAKANFIVRAQQRIRGMQIGLAVPDDCRPPDSQTPGSHQLMLSPVVAPLTGDVLDNLVSPAVAPSLHAAIVCDRSGSTLGATCTPEALLRVFDRWITEGLAQPGASLSVEMVGPLQDSLRSVYHVTVPDLSAGARVSFVLGARRELAQLLDGSGEKYASTIAEAISATVRRLREQQGRYQLVVLSDLLQLTSGVWNFDQAVPSPDDFLAWLKSSGLAADLRNIPVLSCGLHTGHFGSYSAAHATQLHGVWKAAFEGMGAPEVKLFSSCDAGFAAS